MGWHALVLHWVNSYGTDFPGWMSPKTAHVGVKTKAFKGFDPYPNAGNIRGSWFKSISLGLKSCIVLNQLSVPISPRFAPTIVNHKKCTYFTPSSQCKVNHEHLTCAMIKTWYMRYGRPIIVRDSLWCICITYYNIGCFYIPWYPHIELLYFTKCCWLNFPISLFWPFK